MILYMLKQLNNIMLVGILAVLIGMSILVFLENKENFSCAATCGFLSGCVSFIGVIILCFKLL